MSETSNVPFDRADVDGLTDQIGRFASHLTPEEWRLLLAIFYSASSHFDEVSVTPPQAPEKGKRPPEGLTVTQLRRELRKAYQPGKTPPPGNNFQVTPPAVNPGHKKG